jgi:hypothetical protein
LTLLARLTPCYDVSRSDGKVTLKGSGDRLSLDLSGANELIGQQTATQAKGGVNGGQFAGFIDIIVHYGTASWRKAQMYCRL